MPETLVPDDVVAAAATAAAALWPVATNEEVHKPPAALSTPFVLLLRRMSPITMAVATRARRKRGRTAR